jgi:putative addiction module killer protein
MNYIITQTHSFAHWLEMLKDKQAQLSIARRLERASAGNFGDVKSVGDGVSEMRIHMGAGYRVYFTVRHRQLVFLLVGGDKSTQTRDIQHAIQLAKDIE